MHVFVVNKVISCDALWRLKYQVHTKLISLLFSSFPEIEKSYCLTIILCNWLLTTCYTDKLFLVNRWTMPKDNFTCKDFGYNFTRISNLHLHRRTIHDVESCWCSSCGRWFNRRDNHQCHVIQDTMLEIHIKDLIRGMILSYWPSHKTVKKNTCPNIQNQIGSGGSSKSYQER